MLRFRMCLVAAFASPLSRIGFDNFLVAAFGETGGVGDVVLLDVDDGGFGGEVVGVFGHSQVLLLDLEDGLHGVTSASGSCHCAIHLGVRGELVVLALSKVPAL